MSECYSSKDNALLNFICPNIEYCPVHIESECKCIGCDGIKCEQCEKWNMYHLESKEFAK